MSLEKTTLEIIAPSVEEAVNRGLSQLGLPNEAVEVEVLDPGSHGFLGIGSRQARIRLRIKDESQKKADSSAGPQSKAQPVFATVQTQVSSPVSAPASEPARQKGASPAPVQPVTAGDEHKLQVAIQVVHELLERMKVTAEVTAHFVEASDPKEEAVVLVEIQGDDLSILIGRRSETLNALQYIASLIVGKELGEWVPMMIDVQGYRARRERQLRQIARRMAEQAVHTGKRQVLEPMPANERRIIHMELHDHPQVTTESLGEEPNRKVTISPKK
jgi:spoIIIJ-associated protein